jgi:hypothetical protein
MNWLNSNRIYKLINWIDWVSSRLIDSHHISHIENSEYKWLIKEWYILVWVERYKKLKDEYRDQVKFIEWFWDVTIDWLPAPFERMEDNYSEEIRLTDKWRIFIHRYNNIINRIELYAIDYPFIFPIVGWFLWWILSSLIIHRIT